MLTRSQPQDTDQQSIVQNALSALATDMAALSGNTFYEAICHYLVTNLSLDYAFVGKLNADGSAVEVQAGRSGNSTLPAFTYDLAHTPCANVFEKSQEVYVSGIQGLFPNDVLLQEMQIESYAGSALFNAQDEPMGILVGLGRQPLHDAALTRELLGLFVERVAAEMTRTQSEISASHQEKYQRLILELSTAFINLPLEDVDPAIENALARIGQFFNADRAYVFTYDLTAVTATNTHEWCAPGISAEIDNQQHVPLDEMPEWLAHHLHGETFQIPDVDALPDSPIKVLLQSQDIKSLITLPLMDGKKCLGFVGFDAVTHHKHYAEDEIRLIDLFARLLTNLKTRKRTQASLQQAASVFEHANEGIAITDPDGVIVDVNHTFCAITGYARDEALTLRLSDINAANEAFTNDMPDQLYAKDHWQGEIWWRHKNGEVYAVKQTISVVRNDDNEIKRYVVLVSDITEIKQQQKQLEHIAYHDALTQLPNRILLSDRLQQALTQARRHRSHLAVAYLDLDGFKPINDQHGHDLGDKVLTQMAARMQSALRDGDTLSRLGGDEFVAVLRDLQDIETSRPVLDRLLAAASAPLVIDGLELNITASMGVSFYSADGDVVDADHLLRQADQAMYQAKQNGKNRYFIFDTEHEKTIRGHQENIQRLQEALAANEFSLLYQPKVNMQSGEVIGLEALIRWHHPTRGVLRPGKFLPMIENHALNIDLGEWVLENVLQQIQHWQKYRVALPVSVNINAIQLNQSDFIDKLQQTLARYPDVPAELLQLEILETSALRDIEQVSGIIKTCKNLGVHFALDDFGTGYSSLTYLKQLPIQYLKIDQSFIAGLPDKDKTDDLSILEAVMSLAEAFQLQVIAEGVETPEHRDILLKMGCELGQGHAFAYPMEPELVIEWMNGWQS